MNVLRNLTNSIAFRIKLIAFSGFQKNSRFVLKNHFFSRRNQFCQRFETSYYFNCILQQIFNFGDFYKINCFFEKPIYFNFYNQILKVSRSLTFSVEFYRKFATFSSFFLGKSNFSFQKIHHNVPSENLKVEPFENFQSPNAIVEPTCYF